MKKTLLIAALLLSAEYLALNLRAYAADSSLTVASTDPTIEVETVQEASGAVGERRDKDRGGQIEFRQKVEEINSLLTGGGLKKALLEYFRDFDLRKVGDPEVRATLAHMLTGDALQKAIEKSKFEIKSPCKDAFNEEVNASTDIGDRGGPICYDSKAMAGAYLKLSMAETMAHLGAVSLHEFAHQFQTPLSRNLSPEERKVAIQALEKEAYKLSSQFIVTAGFSDVPLFKYVDEVNLAFGTEMLSHWNHYQIRRPRLQAGTQKLRILANNDGRRGVCELGARAMNLYNENNGREGRARETTWFSAEDSRPSPASVKNELIAVITRKGKLVKVVDAEEGLKMLNAENGSGWDSRLDDEQAERNKGKLVLVDELVCEVHYW